MRFDEMYPIQHLAVSIDPTGDVVVLPAADGYVYVVTSYLLTAVSSASIRFGTYVSDPAAWEALTGTLWVNPMIQADHSPFGHFVCRENQRLFATAGSQTVSGYINYIKMPTA